MFLVFTSLYAFHSVSDAALRSQVISRFLIFVSRYTFLIFLRHNLCCFLIVSHMVSQSVFLEIHHTHTVMFTPKSSKSSKSSKTPTPKQDFKQRLKSAKKSGSTVRSDKRKSSGRVVEFEDGATLRLLSTGHMVHDFPDGSKVQRNPDGAEIKVKQTIHTNSLLSGFCYYFYLPRTILEHYILFGRSTATERRRRKIRMVIWSFNIWTGLPSHMSRKLGKRFSCTPMAQRNKWIPMTRSLKPRRINPRNRHQQTQSQRSFLINAFVMRRRTAKKLYRTRGRRRAVWWNLTTALNSASSIPDFWYTITRMAPNINATLTAQESR